MTLHLIAILLLVALSAFFSASETAYSSLTRARIQAVADNGSWLAKLALRLVDDFDELLSTILVGNNIVNIAAASLCSLMCVRYLPDISLSIPTAILTIDILFFGEITPKSLAREYPEQFAKYASLPLYLLKVILWPVNRLFIYWKRMLAACFHFGDESKLSQEELLLIVDEAQQDGNIDQDEGILLRNAIKFTTCRVEEILTPRVDIEAVPVESTYEEVGRKFSETQFTRLVVYSGSIDKIVGIIGLKDYYASQKLAPWNLQDVMSEPFLVQKTAKIGEVLKQFQKNRAQLAVVLDEFGGTLGLVSIEDILEELVGEIWDEHDEVEEKSKKIGDNIYLLDGTTSLDDFQDAFHTKLDSKETIVSGWVLENLTSLPKKGDHFSYQNLDIVITSCSNHRIRQIKVTVNPVSDEKESQTEQDSSRTPPTT